ncbi:MAG: hypothetical protein KBE23_05525 [Chloroflexi bacterium]|nr:hypothetical protein [Chloroflexota bacterium]MBP7042181.1 hypothetical protein [Chloroflexota bacterium]
MDDEMKDNDFPEMDPMPEKEEPPMFNDLGGMDMSDDDKLWALLAYVLAPLVPVIILLMEDKKKRPFIRAHNGQALAWGLINMVAGTLLSTFLCGIPSLAIWLIGCYWGWQAYQGQMVTIPVVTDFVKKQGWA